MFLGKREERGKETRQPGQLWKKDGRGPGPLPMPCRVVLRAPELPVKPQPPGVTWLWV